ncbi:MAG: putative secreted protein [Acidobacteria bacterium]|nr:putative secreted protein [Acidobacteriota bacterium]
MRRFLAALSLTIAGLAFVLGFKTREPVAVEAADTTQPNGQSGAPDTSTTIATAGGEATTTTEVSIPTPVTTSSQASAEAAGTTVQTPYGPVQVAIVVENGVLVDVAALQLPGGNRESDSINSYAAPLLEEMALQAQSAQIDVVSGATFTSAAYAQSLQAALDQVGL